MDKYPRLFSFSSASSVVLACALIGAQTLGATPTLDSEQSAFLTLINNYRSQNGVGPLQVSVGLQNSSQWMSTDMATKNYFSHTDSLGRDPFTRMKDFGYPYAPAGENIAAGNSDAQNTFNQWLTACDADANGVCTYAHRENMRNGSYKVIGIGRAYSATALYRFYWTTDFGGVVDQTIGPAAPTADSVSPSSGSGIPATFTFKYSSGNGFAYLNAVYGLINTAVNGADACFFEYYRPTNTLYLFSDAATSVAGSITPGAGTSVGNSQCTISGSGLTASGSSNTLTLTVPVTFGRGFIGPKTIFGYAADQGNLNSGWQTLGSWTPNVAQNLPPTADSVTPAAGSGSAATFTFKYSSPNGFGYLDAVYGLFNTSVNGAGACFFEYYRPTNILYLFSDAATSVAGGVTPGAGTTIANSQCSISGAGFSVSGSGNHLTLTVPVTFGGAFTGTKNIYGYAADQSNLNSGWRTLGTWTH